MRSVKNIISGKWQVASGLLILIISCSAELKSPEQIWEEARANGTLLGSSSSEMNNIGGGTSSGTLGNASSSSRLSNSSASQPSPTDALQKSGHYTSSFTLTLPEYVYCDRTGAAPTTSSAMKPGTSHTVSQTTILRCLYYKDSRDNGNIPVMRTYIFGRIPTLPIVSIAANPYDFSSKYNTTSGDYELPIHVDFFEKGTSGNLPITWSYPAELGPMGNASRASEFKKKSVSVSFKEKYGQKNLQYRLFPDAPYPAQLKYKHFILRNNGNNWQNDYIRDMLMTSITDAQPGETPAKGLDIDYQKGRAVVVYYNGEYYGIHNMRERSNSDYFETNYNINEDYINLVKIKGSDTEISRGSADDYLYVLSWLNGLTTLSNDNMEYLKTKMDVDNFTNHFQSRIYYNDRDWPGNNMKVWNSPMSPKLRFFMHDTDHGFGSWGTQNQEDLTMMQVVTATNGPSWPNPPNSTLILRRLLTNTKYQNAFINRFSLLIATYFAPARVNARINKLMADINNEIPYDVKHGPGYRPLSTIQSYANGRPYNGVSGYSQFPGMQSEITSFFGLGTPVDLSLSVSGGGNVFVDGLQVLNNSATFKVYPTVPITLKAGPGFKNWSDGVTAAERTETITTATTLTAQF